MSETDIARYNLVDDHDEADARTSLPGRTSAGAMKTPLGGEHTEKPDEPQPSSHDRGGALGLDRGLIGVTFAPGKKQRNAATGS